MLAAILHCPSPRLKQLLTVLQPFAVATTPALNCKINTSSTIQLTKANPYMVESMKISQRKPKAIGFGQPPLIQDTAQRSFNHLYLEEGFGQPPLIQDTAQRSFNHLYLEEEIARNQRRIMTEDHDHLGFNQLLRSCQHSYYDSGQSCVYVKRSRCY